MADNTSTLLNSGSVIPYDMPEIEAVMKHILYENGITDVLYEGSNISQLTSVISYVIGTLNVNTAVNLQETILPLATKRMNILFGARQLGYEAHAKKSYKYELTLRPKYDELQTTLDNQGNTVVDTSSEIPRFVDLVKNTQFVSGGNVYYYLGDTISNFFGIDGVSNWDISNPDISTATLEKIIEVTEGNLITYDGVNADATLSFTAREFIDPDGNRKVEQEFVIPHHDIEDNGIQVFVKNIDYSAAPIDGLYKPKTVERTKSKQYLIDETFSYDQNKFIRLENIILQYPVIFFEYAGMGQPIEHNDQIFVNVLISKGTDGIAEGDFQLVDTAASEIFEVDNLKTKLTQVGTSAESDASIKINAPVFNNTANRAVTKLDYIAISKKIPDIKEAEAWGGEEEIVPDGSGDRYIGNVWISAAPHSIYEYLHTDKTESSLESYEQSHGLPIISEDISHNWYLTDEEINGTDEESLIPFLDFYKIITMDINHRHPLYVDFEFECDIIKYDLTKSKYEVNKSIFEGIRDYFTDQMEIYGAEYLNSNLQRVLDGALAFDSGIGFTTKATGCVFNTMRDVKTGFTHASLAFPFEDMFTETDGYINTDSLPRIDTPDFGNATAGTGAALSVDYSALSGMNLGLNEMVTDIIYDSVVIGEYKINRKYSTIDLTFDFPDEVFFDDVTPTPENPGLYAHFNINYPYTSEYNYNIPFTKNTMPRLTKVEFKDN